jgi:hypothetical protein
MDTPERAVVSCGLALFIAVAAWQLARGFRAPPDVAQRCSSTAVQPCLSRENAFVRSVDREQSEVTILWDGGRRKTTLTFRELPREGAELLLERWAGKPVALWDDRRERRFRARSWPVRWSWSDFWLWIVVVVVFGVPLVLVARGYRRRPGTV